MQNLICNNCRKPEVDPEHNFCHACGIPQEQPKAKSFKCSDCGNQALFSKDVEEQNYIAGVGFICDHCLSQMEEVRLQHYDWQTDC